jgi:flagellar motor switch protein FliM
MSPRIADLTRNRIFRIMRKATVPVDAILGRAVLPVSEIARLQVGDVVQLDSVSRDPIIVEVGGLSRYKAQPGRYGEQSAVQLTQLTLDE